MCFCDSMAAHQQEAWFRVVTRCTAQIRKRFDVPGQAIEDHLSARKPLGRRFSPSPLVFSRQRAKSGLPETTFYTSTSCSVHLAASARLSCRAGGRFGCIVGYSYGGWRSGVGSRSWASLVRVARDSLRAAARPSWADVRCGDKPSS